jgi:hypothetical protein
MSLRRKRRRKREQRRHHETHPSHRPTPADELHEIVAAPSSPDWALRAQGELSGLYADPRSASTEDPHDAGRAPAAVQLPSRALREADEVRRLAYTRRQAAEALGVSMSTIDRRIVPTIDTVMTPWGQRLIPVEELEHFLRDHLKPARVRPARRPAGRPPDDSSERRRADPARVPARSRPVRDRPRAHGRRCADRPPWSPMWPLTVRAVFVRSSSP